MLKTWATKWVKALRSGKYKQTQAVLCRKSSDGSESHCCLGVLCEIVKVKRQKTNIGSIIAYGKEKNKIALPKEVMQKTGIKNNEGKIVNLDSKLEVLLSGLNDSGKTFNEIADIIEDGYKSL